MGEKGVSIAVLVVDGEPTCQFEKGKQDIFTTLAIRYVLDNANSTSHAISLLHRYNMFAIGGKDYHFYICDKNGNCVTVEYAYDNKDIRILKTTSTNIITNIYMYDENLEPFIDEVLPDEEVIDLCDEDCMDLVVSELIE